MILEKVAKVSDQMAESRRKFNERYNNLLSSFLPELEDKVLGSMTEHRENLWFVNSKNNGITDSLKSMKAFEDRNALHIAN